MMMVVSVCLDLTPDRSCVFVALRLRAPTGFIAQRRGENAQEINRMFPRVAGPDGRVCGGGLEIEEVETGQIHKCMQ